MQLHIASKIIVFLMTLFVFIITGCKNAPIMGGPITQNKLTDGIYEGESKFGPNSVKVKVIIKNQNIVSVELVAHDAWKGHKADEAIPSRIVDQQSTEVDAVTGATNSSHVIMNAVENAIQKSYQAGEETT